PTVLELGAVGVDGPSAHLDPWVHMTVDEESRPPAVTLKSADGLAAHLLRVEGMRHLLHFHFESDARHVVSVEVGDVAFLKRRTRNSDRPLLQIEYPLLVNRRKCGPRVTR